MARHDAKQTSASKAPKKALRSTKQLHQTLLTATSPLTQQHPSNSTNHPRKSKKPSFNSQFSSDDSSTDSLVQLQYGDTPPTILENTEEDQLSDTTEQMDNTLEKLSDSRVDLKIKAPPSDTPEETTIYILQQMLLKLKTYDPKIGIAPWQEKNPSPPIFSHTDIPSRPSELEHYFPRIRYLRSGLTWYSGLRLLHTIPIPELRKDMLPWLKEEGHGLFTRTLQAENIVDVGWLFYSTWEMETEALALAISDTINIEVGLRWKMISLGTRTKIPPEQQVRALHVEVSVENRLSAQKALLAVYGRKSSDTYPNGVRLRLALPLSSAYNLTTKAKLERLRSRQQLWSQTYQKGQSWEITQLDYKLTPTLTLRQALTKITSTTDARFPLFHSVDRLTGKAAGVSFQFLPELESEARLMISNLLPYVNHHYGDTANQCFTPSAVDRLKECTWDPEAGVIVGAFDEEINFLDEDDLMAQYISTKSPPPATLPAPQLNSPNPPTTPLKSLPPLTTTAYGNDDDSVSTLGNHTTRKWSPGKSPSPLRSPITVTNISHSTEKLQHISDDRSLGSVSTLNTRVNSIEGHMQELTGTMEHIKHMLTLLANPKAAQDGDPRPLDNAGQGDLAGDAS